MPGNAEEKEKCVEKLVQMERFLPFLDYMINKINKKHHEIPLECQLGKFQLIKSMIAEKNGKYNWDIIVKVEDVIQKLITKLDYKEKLKETKTPLTEVSENKAEMAALVSVPSSTTTTISVSNASTSTRTSTVDSINSAGSDQIARTLKMPFEKGKKNIKDGDTENTPSGSELSGSGETSNKELMSNIDKDLDGFDLDDYSNTASGDTRNSEKTLPEKITFNGDLLSSSREKLLKSLQQKLHGYKSDNVKVLEQNKAIEKTSVSALSSDINQTQTCDKKVKSYVNRTSENSSVHKHAMESKFSHDNVCKQFYYENFSVESGRSEYSMKQKLREKLSADICEVYRVSGKSVGGSLRSLKEHRKPLPPPCYEEELFKPDKVTEKPYSEVSKLSCSSSSKKDLYENSEKPKKDRITNQNKSENLNKSEKTNPSKKKKDQNKEEPCALEKIDDDELLNLVKENTQALPHLAKLKLGELKKAVTSSSNLKTNFSDLDGISDDSFEDLDEFMNDLSNITSSPKVAEGKDAKKNKEPFNAPKTTEKSSENAFKASKRSEPIGGDASEKNETDDLNDEDFAQKLIEDLTPNPTIKKKKGLLELPLPCTDPADLNIPVTNLCISERDPRKKKLLLQALAAKNSPVDKPETRNYGDCVYETPCVVSKDSFVNSKQPIGFEAPNSQINTYYENPLGNKRLDETIRNDDFFRQEEARISGFYRNVDNSHFFQFNNRFPGGPYDPRFPNNFIPQNMHLNATYFEVPKNFPCRTYEPRSYAEYKRMKRIESQKACQQEPACKDKDSNFVKENDKIIDVEPVNSDKQKPQTSEIQSSKSSDSCPKNKFSKTNNLNRFQDNRGKITGNRNQVDNFESNSKEMSRRKSCSEELKRDHGETKNKIGNDRKMSSDSEELVSPLEKLYEGEEKPKTGRGYGLQNFKIPKKNREPSIKTSKFQNENVTNENKDSFSNSLPTKSNENQAPTTDITVVKSGSQNQIHNQNISNLDEKVTRDSKGKETSEGKEINMIKNANIPEKIKENTSGNPSQHSGDVLLSEPISEQLPLQDSQEKVNVSISSCPVKDVSSKMVNENELGVSKTDSSPESNNTAPNKDSGLPTENSSVISKEEITQEFVEALIRKSFQSGEGRLLLAQAKLFEEFARKLNSKKLKTIQKIINSESESSSSSDSSSEEEKKKQRDKKMKKRKKKAKRNKIIITSSSSSSSEESNDEEKAEKKEETSFPKSDTSCGKNTTLTPESNGKSNNTCEQISDSSDNLMREKSKDIDVGNCISKKKTKRKQGQKKLLEQILNETPSSEGVSELKTKPKPKTKVKTELDRLHDDIRNMFICSGVVTATGQRMCRILKESGGNMNNLDIVKESAKMVEEEKLKKVGVRPSRMSKLDGKSRNRSADRIYSRDRSKSRNRQEEQINSDEENKKEMFAEILEKQPVVLLNRVNLDNFGFGVKISENCISFSRLRGSNTAIRGIPFKKDEEQNRSVNPIERFFLPRNLRKLDRMKGKKVKKGYTGKKLAEIVKSLPLKMASMKHLKIEPQGENKNLPGTCKADVKQKSRNEYELTDLLNYSFVKKRTEYPCRLCSKVLTNITSHYKNVHPLSEVLISRLNKAEARRAKADSLLNNNYEKEEPVGSSLVEEKAKRFYHCRMCLSPKFTDLHAFFIHVSGHTGEYKYQCPAQDCGVAVQTRDDLKLHILQKHEKRRCEMYNKLTEFFVLPNDASSTLFGYLCSFCNYVQLNLQNVESHIEREHSFCRNVSIIKIDMSSKLMKNIPTDNVLHSEKNLLDSANDEKNNVPITGEQSLKTKKSEKFTEIKTYNVKKVQNQISLQSHEDFQNKIPEVGLASEETEVLDIKPDVKTMLLCLENTPKEDECVPINSSINNDQHQPIQPSREFTAGETIAKVKVGPLEAQLLENSKVSYECYVKGCFFTTIDYTLFEKHLNISHGTVKWDGVCDICSTFTKPTFPKTFNLEKALEHLKHHQNLMEELKMEVNEEETTKSWTQKTSAQVDSEPCKQTIPEPTTKVEAQSKESGEAVSKSDNVETTNPTKPLLRVRNLLGDRLSTPKDTSVEEGKVTLEKNDKETGKDEAVLDSKEDSPVMFTIENVRSLKCETDMPDDDDDDVQVEEILSPSKTQNKDIFNENKRSVVIRPCPTPKITIRPETSSVLPLEVSKVKILPGQVVLNPPLQNSSLHLVPGIPPISTASNIEIGSPFSGKRKLVTILPATLKPPPPSVIPITTITAVDKNSNKNKKGRTKVYRPEKNTLSPESPVNKTQPEPQEESAETEQKASNSPAKIHGSPTMGNKKKIKDAKVYQEMLTKTKLCHLFKCMSVECSFTCNNETVFKQHIGLHEARKRVKGEKKCLRTFVFENSRKFKKFYTWQQCSYCCEILMNSSSTLSQHIVKEHGHCIYQCAFCFYRAVSQSYVEIHQNSAHSQTLKTSPRLIYRCKALTTGPNPSEALEKQGKRQSVRPYICDQCGLKFFITQDFMNHLTTEHQSVTAYTCHICKNLCFKADRLIVHYKLHLYCTYQCPYCLHGTETQKEMLFHLCNFHFSQIPCMYVRDLADNQACKVVKRTTKKKKSTENQLESLKVIFYESDSIPPDCIVDADVEEEVVSECLSATEIQSLDVTESGLEKSDVASTPVMQELIAMSGSKPQSLTVKKILPNTLFSSEIDISNPETVALESGSASVERKEEFSVALSSRDLSSVYSPTVALEDKTIKAVENNQEENLKKTEEEKKNDEIKSGVGGVHKLPLKVVERANGTKSLCQAKSIGSIACVNPKVLEEKSESEISGEDMKMKELLYNIHKFYKICTPRKISRSKPKPEPKLKSEPEVKKIMNRYPNVTVSRTGWAKNVYPGKSIQKTPENKYYTSEDNEVGKHNTKNSNACENPNDQVGKIANEYCNMEEKEDDSGNVFFDENKLSSVTDDNENASSQKIVKDSRELAEEAKNCKAEEEIKNDEKSTQPVITNVVSLSGKSQDMDESAGSIVIADICSLSYSEQDIADPSKIVVNFQPKIRSSTALKPPVIRVEDYVVDEEESKSHIESKKCREQSGDSVEAEAKSPEVVILEEEKHESDVLTVTLDSDEDLEPENDPLMIKPDQNKIGFCQRSVSTDDTIRKEMELLREQMASETDCLLFDDLETGTPQLPQSAENPMSTKEEKNEESISTNQETDDECIPSLMVKVEMANEKEMNREIENSKKNENVNIFNTVLSRTRYATRKSLLKSETSEAEEKSESESGGTSENENKKTEGKGITEGLVGKDLFICGNEKCNFRGEEESQLKEHLWVCDLSRESIALVCPHCHRKFKQFNCYIEHIKQHGEKKFFCGLCSFSTAVDCRVIRHLKQKHKCMQYKITPKDSTKRDHFLFYPKNHKTETPSFEEKGYSPGDEDKLPLQSVYQINVKCAVCPYFTKVRSNMVRHLKIHAKSAETEGSVIVPSTAPTNPVPCLDTKEKMFDKMTNLAASSQLAKEKSFIEGLSPEEEAKLPQFVVEQMRYKCCLPDCNYITVDEGMLKHHIKALHDEISYYSCPHCKTTVHVDVRHVTLDKIGHHLKHHDTRLYKCAHCIYFHYQKNIVEKHTVEKHPDRRFFVLTVREPKVEVSTEEEHLPKEPAVSVMWKCGLCDFQSPVRFTALDHLGKKHNSRSKYKCKLCPKKSNNNQYFAGHFASKHPGEKVEVVSTLTKIVSSGNDSQSVSSGAESSSEHFDTTPLWQRGAPRVRHIRGILIEEEEVKTKKSKRMSGDCESETPMSVSDGNAFYCPLCTDKKKIFYTKNPECFRFHLYQELNYQQFACILCGKMFVDKKDFDKHHAKQHPDKPPSMKQTKEDGEIMFWVDKVIAKQEEQMRKRKLSENEEEESQRSPKRKKQLPNTS